METDNVISIDTWKQKTNEIQVVNSLRRSAILLINNGYNLSETKNVMLITYGEKYSALINEVIQNIERTWYGKQCNIIDRFQEQKKDK